MDNREQASDIFREALKLDPYCQEALHYLTKHQMLSAEQEQSLLDSIPLEDEEKEMIHFLYSIGKSNFYFKIIPLDGNSLKISSMCFFYHM